VKKPTASASSDDDTMSYFAKLAAD
jgi:hypothetical protein